MSRRVTREEINTIAQMMEARQIPVHVWLPIMHLESGGNVLAHNPRGEDSRGLFQINLQAGDGGKHTPDFVRELDLFDPIVNAGAILSHHWLGNRDRVKRMLGKGAPDEQAAYMYRTGVRPRWTDTLEAQVRHLSTEGLDELKRRYGLAEEFIYEPPAHYWETPWEKFIREGEGDLRPDVTPPAVETGLLPEEAPSWANPFARLWWEWQQNWQRILIVIIGLPVLIIAVVLLFAEPKDIITKIVNVKTAGMVNMKSKGEEI